MKRIRIACLGQDLSGGGAERVQLELLKRLDRDSFSIDLCYLRDRGDLYDLVPADLVPVFFSPGQLPFKEGVCSAFKKYKAIARNADVLFGMMDGIPIYLASLVGWLEDKASIGWVHNTTSICFKDCNHLHRYLAPIFYPRASQLVSVSNGARDDLRHLYKFKGAQPATIYNPIDVDRVRDLATESLPAGLAPWYDKPVVIGVGRLCAQKRFDYLIRAFAAEISNGLDANLVLVGQGELLEPLKGLADQMNVASRVLFAGFHANPYPLIKAATVLVLTSAFEGLGNVLLESMGVGTAVLSVDCPSGPREILEGGKNGVLVPVDEIDALGSGIQTLLGNEPVRKNYVARGLRRVEEFSAARAVLQFEEMFRALVRTKNASAHDRPNLSQTSAAIPSSSMPKDIQL